MATTHTGPPHLRLIKGGSPPPAFTGSKVQVLLSEIEHGGTSRAKIKELSEAIQAKIDFLEVKLAHDSRSLREGLQDFLVGMASSRGSEVSGSGVDFKDPSDPKKVLITLANGETDSPAAQPKIDRIISICMEVAKSDLDFLRTALATIRRTGSVSTDQFPKLKDILDKNSYWRLVELT